MLPRTTALHCLPDNPLVSSDTHSALSMAGQGVVPGEYVSAKTLVRLVSGVDLCVPFEVVAAHETLAAMLAFVLTISQVCLDVRFDILLSTESAPTLWMKTHPFSIFYIGTEYEGRDLVRGDSCFVDRCMNSGVEIQVVNGCRAWRELRLGWGVNCGRIGGPL